VTVDTGVCFEPMSTQPLRGRLGVEDGGTRLEQGSSREGGWPETRAVPLGSAERSG